MAVDTLERIYPKELNPSDEFDEEVVKLHIERYRFAARHIKGKRILDIACGSGYGAPILLGHLSKHARYVGVDIDPAAIHYARKNYRSPRVKFLRVDAMKFINRGKFDSIVCLETLEHLSYPEKFIKSLVGKLSKGGVLVVSAPITLTTDANPHHIHDFTNKDFLRLFTQHGLTLQSSISQLQRYSPLKLLIGGESKRVKTIRKNLVYFYLIHPKMILKRLLSVLRFGFNNKYIVVVWANAKGVKSSR